MALSLDNVLEKLQDQSNYLVVMPNTKECFLDEDDEREPVEYGIFESLLADAKIKILADVGDETMYIIVPPES
ncbi:MAG: hypothetical protein NXI20_13120 [bacterium]|nr:hypothetical protein [bacterium]